VEYLPETTLSLPRIIGSDGISATLHPALSDDEQKALEQSAAILRDTARLIGF
jgi:L-lactate dehydrogenase